MEISEEIGYMLIGAFLYFLVLYLIVTSAVKAGSASQTYNLKIMNRLLIKLLRKQGVSKKELIDLHNSDNDTFWASIEED